MYQRYVLVLVLLFAATAAAAQHADTVVVQADPIIVRTHAVLFDSLLPRSGEGVSEGVIVRPDSDAVCFVRRFRVQEGDSVYAFLHRVLDRSWTLRGALPGLDSLYSPVRFRRAFPDSALRIFRLADSLRGPSPRVWFEETRPGLRLEELEVAATSDSMVVRLWWPGMWARPGAERRVVVYRDRPATRSDGVLVVPDGRGETWIYLPPEENE